MLDTSSDGIDSLESEKTNKRKKEPFYHQLLGFIWLLFLLSWSLNSVFYFYSGHPKEHDENILKRKKESRDCIILGD